MSLGKLPSMSDLFSVAESKVENLATSKIQSVTSQAQEQIAQVQEQAREAEKYVITYAGLTLLFQGLSAAGLLYLAFREGKKKSNGKRR